MKLELASLRMLHGQACVCPRCGTPGRFFRHTSRRCSFNDYIHFNSEFDEFECYQCEERR